ncbi:unnamed protein product [Allacma fusca]|uniref:Serine/threonine-protein kinase RIO1 n=1 Tax=Allacma fusca TaxID=39272 RepID=A0A8J2KJ76_9HEXA|nr:unnamed protein product [Allacma fusca]
MEGLHLDNLQVEDSIEGQFDDADEEDSVTLNNLRNHTAIFGLNIHTVGEMGFEDEDGEDEDSCDSDDDFEFYNERAGPNCQRKPEMQGCNQTADEMYRKYVSKVNVDKYEGANLSASAANKMIATNKKLDGHKLKVKDKQDRATVEQVMDPRTRMILFKLISSDKMTSIDGCISTGKEANVYHATAPDGSSLAIKIYKTSILTFKARDKYVSGDFRFRNGYCRKNPRKMVRTWAEKEFRNLSRIHSSGTVLVPCPRILKSHVVVMDFIGENGWPAPLLQDVKFDLIDFSAEHLKEFTDVHEDDHEESDKVCQAEEMNPIQMLLKKLYRDSLLILYRMYKHCRLVHADFSSFNLILKDFKDLYVIDVSQSVEHDHPRSLDFLRSDIKNVQDFFGKRGILVGDDENIFNYITSPNVDDSNSDLVLEGILKAAKRFEEFDVSKEVFRQTFIPKKMNEVPHFERDIKKAKRGKDLIYTNLLGLKSDLSGPSDEVKLENVDLNALPEKENKCQRQKQLQTNSQQIDEDVSDESGSSCSDSDDEESKFVNSSRPRHETAEEKRERKKAIKSEKASKREGKIKKHVKKRKEKLAHANSKR